MSEINRTVRYPKGGPLRFDPATVCYYRHYVKKKGFKANGQPHKPSGPYWYAYWHDRTGMHCVYVGKELPPECLPFKDNKVNKSISLPEVEPTPNISHSYDYIRAALDRGSQVVIDLDYIAKHLDAYLDHVGSDKYIIYRDPNP